MCSFFTWHYWSLLLCECRWAYSNREAEWYIVMLETFLRIELHPRQQDLLCFQHNGATAHRAQISIQVLSTLFPGRLISCFGDITWPACSPDLAVPDYFLWATLKTRYTKHPANIDDPKQCILECIQGIPKEMLQCVKTAFPS